MLANAFSDAAYSTAKVEEAFNPSKVKQLNNHSYRCLYIKLRLYMLGKNHQADGCRAMEIMSLSSNASLLQAFSTL